MNARWGLVALASGALALGLLSPVAVSAAPTAAKPSGEALVRIDGGSARAIKKGHNLYRVVLPREASIKWMGESDRALRVGTLGRQGLVAGWVRLGHSASGTHAMTTVTWQRPGEFTAPYVGAYVGKPRINGDGVLTFLAKTAAPLPSELPNFSLNIARPAHQARATRSNGYPLAFPLNASSGTVGVQATATADNKATIVFGMQTNGVMMSACSSPATMNLTGDSSGSTDSYPFSGTCGDTSWKSGSVSFTPMAPGGSAQLQMTAVYVVNGGTFKWNFNMGQWNSGGVLVWPK